MQRTFRVLAVLLAIMLVLVGCSKKADTKQVGSKPTKFPLQAREGSITLKAECNENRSGLESNPARNEVGLRDAHKVMLGGQQVLVGMGVRVRGIEQYLESEEQTRVAVIGTSPIDTFSLNGKDYDLNETLRFKNGERIVVFLVPTKVVGRDYWKEIQVKWSEPVQEQTSTDLGL